MRAQHKVVSVLHTKYSATCGWLCAFVFTFAKCSSISSVSLVAKAGWVRPVLGLASCKWVTLVAIVGEAAWIHQTGEPCCVDTEHHSLYVSLIAWHKPNPKSFSDTSPASFSLCVVKCNSPLCFSGLPKTPNRMTSTAMIKYTAGCTGFKYSFCQSLVNEKTIMKQTNKLYIKHNCCPITFWLTWRPCEHGNVHNCLTIPQ